MFLDAHSLHIQSDFSPKLESFYHAGKKEWSNKIIGRRQSGQTEFATWLLYDFSNLVKFMFLFFLTCEMGKNDIVFQLQTPRGDLESLLLGPP